MNVYLKGHDCKYAVEQALMSFFPERRPVYPEQSVPSGDYVLSELDADRISTQLCIASRTALASAEEAAPAGEGDEERVRRIQKLVKLSFFRAAVELEGISPPWGALTGVRPGKIAAGFIERDGCTAEEAAQRLEKEYYVASKRAQLCVQAAQYGLQAKASLAPNDVSLYVGIPFCPTRCAYCSFVSSSVEKSLKLVEPYVNALLREIEGTGRIVRQHGLSVTSVYFGGGTPTTLSSDRLSALLDAMAESFDLSRCREYTVEAGRPDTVTREKLAVLQQRGVTRISINPQTMNDRVLSAIGRRHSSDDILRCYADARSVFSGDINMDLIAGLPADTTDSFISSLDRVIALQPENITVHTLTMKRASTLSMSGAGIPDGDAVGEMLDYSHRALEGADFRPYYLYRQKFSAGGFENVGWCKDGRESIYNICMMEELQTIISMGAGGATKKKAASGGKIDRVFNKKYPYEYIASVDNSLLNLEKLLND